MPHRLAVGEHGHRGREVPVGIQHIDGDDRLALARLAQWLSNIEPIVDSIRGPRQIDGLRFEGRLIGLSRG